MECNISPFLRNFEDILRNATSMGASDIHIEPAQDLVRIRVRLDGNLKTIQQIEDPRLFERFFMQVKRTCAFDMAKHNAPQDARFSLHSLPYDFRASLIPTAYGEKIVLRCLDKNKEFSLKNYPLPEVAKTYLFDALNKWQGLILVSGPTGSGKSTLLYSLLAEIDRETNNVHTLEDPIEYSLEGISQSQINHKELSFASALRALLRQDPDCILVGEIRDQETAKAALHAASTGHLILSTIHANSSWQCLERLQSYGIPREIIEDNLIFASAQRLLPKLCHHCKQVDSGWSELAQKFIAPDLSTLSAAGCQECNQSGISGRSLIFEFIGKYRSESGAKQLKQVGSLREDAITLLRKGDIDAKSMFAFDD